MKNKTISNLNSHCQFAKEQFSKFNLAMSLIGVQNFFTLLEIRDEGGWEMKNQRIQNLNYHCQFAKQEFSKSNLSMSLIDIQNFFSKQSENKKKCFHVSQKSENYISQAIQSKCCSELYF